MPNAAPEWQAGSFEPQNKEMMVACPLEGCVRPEEKGMAVYIIKLQRGNNARTMLRSPNQGYPFSDQ
jgi:hypothetical protein